MDVTAVDLVVERVVDPHWEPFPRPRSRLEIPSSDSDVVNVARVTAHIAALSQALRPAHHGTDALVGPSGIERVRFGGEPVRCVRRPPLPLAGIDWSRLALSVRPP
jgi:hypothetical protein